MPPKKHIPRDELEELVKRGYKLKHLAEHFNCDISVIKRALEEYSIPFEPKFAEKIEIPKEEIIKRIREGKTLKEIAQELGVSYQTLLKRVKEHGIDYREVRIPKDELRRLVKKKMSVAEIADYFKVSQSTIKRRLRKYGLSLKSRMRYHDPAPLNLSRDLLFQWYVVEGMSAEKIATELGVSVSSVHHYLKKYGIPTRKREKKPDPAKEEIERLYYEEGLSFHETARRLEIGTNRLALLMKKYGIKAKPKSRKRYTDEEILEELRRAVERYGRIPQQKELRYDDEFRIDIKTVIRRFGSFRNAVDRVSK